MKRIGPIWMKRGSAEGGKQIMSKSGGSRPKNELEGRMTAEIPEGAQIEEVAERASQVGKVLEGRGMERRQKTNY